MDVDKSELMELVRWLDDEVDEKYVLIAAGGTALTLQNVKTSTKDVDFVVHTGNLDALKEICSKQ